MAGSLEKAEHPSDTQRVCPDTHTFFYPPRKLLNPLVSLSERGDLLSLGEGGYKQF